MLAQPCHATAPPAVVAARAVIIGRVAALSALAALEPHALAAHAHAAVPALRDGDEDVRSAAVGTLFKKLEVTELANHVEQIVERIEDPDGGVRRSAALWARSKLDPGLLGKHAAAIAIGLDDPILSVRRASLEALALTDPAVLATSWPDPAPQNAILEPPMASKMPSWSLRWPPDRQILQMSAKIC